MFSKLALKSIDEIEVLDESVDVMKEQDYESFLRVRIRHANNKGNTVDRKYEVRRDLNIYGRPVKDDSDSVTKCALKHIKKIEIRKTGNFSDGRYEKSGETGYTIYQDCPLGAQWNSGISGQYFKR